jgi:hypothetical protein
MREDGEAPVGHLHAALQRKARRVGKRRGSRTLYESGMPKDSLSAGILKRLPPTYRAIRVATAVQSSTEQYEQRTRRFVSLLQ